MANKNNKKLKLPNLSIDNRLVIPVRMIPFITRWHFLPSEIIKILSGTETWHNVNIQSFCLKTNYSYRLMQRKYLDFNILENTPLVFESEKRSIDTLPAGMFVWLDELETVYENADSHPFSVTKQPDDRKLNLHPYISPEMRKLVFEGFDYKSKTHNHTNYIPLQNQSQKY